MDHIYVFVTLLLVLILFIWGKFRYDLVALFALMVLVMVGAIPSEKAFSGFAHPAVITVAVVLIIGKALDNSGVIDALGKWISRVGSNLTLQLLALTLLVAVTSAFMNNVGALAILMPVTLNLARKSGNPPSHLLMPLAFGSLFGGMTTLIGTPPNIIIASLRAKASGEPFDMFDFTPVGIGLSLLGILFLSLIGWRLLPKRSGQKSKAESFRIDDYITELEVVTESKLHGISLGELYKKSKADIQVLGLVRENKRMHAPNVDEVLLNGDIIILESDTDALKTFVDDTGLKLVGDRKFRKDATDSENVVITEAVVMATSALIGQTTAGMRMRSRYGVNLLAVSRKQKRIHNRLDHVTFRAGDVLMLQGRSQTIDESIRAMGCLPLAERGLRIGFQKNIAVSISVFAVSIALVISGILPVHIAFTLAAGAMILFGILPLKELYTSIDWPVIILLGAMLPVGEALETSGGAAILAEHILHAANAIPAWAILGLLLTVTMLLSGIINNAATVVLMAPIAIGVAHGLNASIDPFLMAIAVGASSSFLTPIAHQSNTLVMGPGGYQFSDYLRLGLPLTILVIAVAIPLILFFWPV
ncbi:MAG: anion permease [Cyclobacteriaceae bacterium]|nr:anion permease [Cyclobacteriaceae bacterium]